MTSTYDHRIIQGAQSGEFLGKIEALLGGGDDFYGAAFQSLGLAVSETSVTAPKPAVTSAAVAAVGGTELLATMQAATSLVKAFRTHGHLGARLDPLGTPPVGDPSMEPSTYDLTPELMAQIPAELLQVYVPGKTLLEVFPNLRQTYCGSIAYEIEHISSHEQRTWLREHIESGAYRLPFSDKEKLRLLHRLTKVDAMERYLRRTFIGQKTFSGEGLDMMVPMLEKLLAKAANDGVAEVIMGMAHRGRLSVIAHVVNRPYESILSAFEQAELRRAFTGSEGDAIGDVKYHMGATGTYITEDDKPITVRLLSNPSHLEAIDGPVEGWTRAVQTVRHSGPELRLERKAAMPLLIHGDAAFSAQGVVAEVLNLQALEGYSTGGTIHIIADNQVGFTTDPRDGRSTRYASDLAKGYDCPIIHVNADDAEACISAVLLAYDFRTTYQRDVVIDLVGYRRFGHNESDEPAYTQPLMYQRIKSHPTAREIFAQRVVDQGLISAEDAEGWSKAVFDRLAEAHQNVKKELAQIDEEVIKPNGNGAVEMVNTAVDAKFLSAASERLLTFPDGFTVNHKLAAQMQRRAASLKEGSIDWGTAESLAFASLLRDGKPVRLTGQDTLRGTFSQRHLAFFDEQTGERYIPMQHLDSSKATFEIYNSPLSEVGALGFEYGYSAADPDTLVLWEAQFGDFNNNAQMIIDQFIVAGRAKWRQRSRLTLLLPHGYEGMGPEHSSARLERFMQLAANDNIRIANCSTSAQYFHLLRDQALCRAQHPLIILTPKSLLRLKESGCSLHDLTNGKFHPVIDDADAASRRKAIDTVLLCSGKVYWEMQLHEMRQVATDVAIVRVEMLHPLPQDEILATLGRYSGLKTVRWVQEEPENMGAWPSLQALGAEISSRWNWGYVGRPRRASPSEGSAGSHQVEQERVILTALRTGESPRSAVRKTSKTKA